MTGSNEEIPLEHYLETALGLTVDCMAEKLTQEEYTENMESILEMIEERNPKRKVSAK